MANSGKLHSVLVVEDDPDIRDILQESLETIGGLSLVLCSSGLGAMEMLKNDLPDLVLLDWMMPGLDGGDVLEKLRSDARTADLPVVVITGKALAKEIEKMRASGATEVISKPFDPVTLATRLAQIHACAAG